MDQVVITVSYNRQEADVELPVSVPLFVLAPMLLDSLSWPYEADSGGKNFVARIGSSGVIIRPNETLAQSDVVDGEILEISTVAGGGVDFDATMLDIERPKFGGQAHLKSLDSEEMFLCRGKSVLVGRSPECPVNLSRMPRADVVSRRHANIIRRNDGFWLTDEHSSNGTFVDGFALEAGASVRLREGSQIQFGKGGPMFVFYAGVDQSDL